MRKRTKSTKLSPEAGAVPGVRSPIEQALTLPNGARFYRCALQVNPHGYVKKFTGQSGTLDEAEYVEAIMVKCVELNIEAIALTDHGSAAEFSAFRDAGERHDIVVFPGFELTSSEGIHVLCIYDPSVEPKKLERHLGALDAHDTSPSSTPSKHGIREILAMVRDQEGVTIAAHITNDGGLLTTLKGQACIDVWKDENLIAVQIPGSVDDVPNEKGWRNILRNKNKDYRRDRPASNDVAVAVVNACDVKESASLDKIHASCWIKMSELSVEGLRQAFLDPGSRIRLSSDQTWPNHAELVAVSWEGGFLDGASIHFNANLNVLVGGRGTGKSSVLESLRYALAIEPIGDDARRQHDGVVRNVLGDGTKITVDICSHHPTKKEYRIERTVPNPPVVRDKYGAVLNLRPADVMPRTEIFGQHEIAELAKSPEKLTRLLDRFRPVDPALPDRRANAQRELERSRRKIESIQSELTHADAQLAALPAVEETLKKFQEAGVEARLQERAFVVREERVLKTAVDRTGSAREIVADLHRIGTIDVAFLSDKSLDPLPAKGLLKELKPALAQLEETIETATEMLEKALVGIDRQIANVRDRWNKRRELAQAEYERILRELQRDKVDGGEFIRLRTQIEELKPVAERSAILEKNLVEEQDRRRTLAAEWDEIKGVEYRALDRAAKEVNAALAGRVRVRVSAGGDRKPLTDLLREAVGGTLAQTIRALEEDDALSLPELASLCRGAPADLSKRFGIPAAQGTRLANGGDALAMKIEELRLTPTTFVELNVAAEDREPEWRTLDELSSGQKATAVLLLLLLESDAPLVVDQPEDDLDNRFISDGIVPTMRREKRQRQFIFTTHNANIPVLGDAELIVGLETRSEDGRLTAVMPADQMGSIDKDSVRQLVEELLEGGKDAFETRRRKYDF